MQAFWIPGHLALVLLSLAYWDIYLFKRFMESPVPMAVLAVIFILVVMLRELARVPCRGAERGRQRRAQRGGAAFRRRDQPRVCGTFPRRARAGGAIRSNRVPTPRLIAMAAYRL